MQYFKVIFIGVVLIFSGCSNNYNAKPKVVTKSLYLNKSLTKFEMDNGFCYKREPLPNGGYKNYWRSDKGSILANALSWDSYPYCELALITDKNNIVRKIEIIEDDIKCVGALK